MKSFARLVQRLEESQSEAARMSAMVWYFRKADSRDALWAMALLSGKKCFRTVRSKVLREWLAEISELPLWLFNESYQQLGDVAETAALLLPDVPARMKVKSLHHWMEQLASWKALSPDQLRHAVLAMWAETQAEERYLLTKIVLSTFRPPVRLRMLAQALSEVYAYNVDGLTERLSQDWNPLETSVDALMPNETTDANSPYTFAQWIAADAFVTAYGEPNEWLALWHWNAPRVQWVARNQQSWVWTEHGELQTEAFPQLKEFVSSGLSGFVLEGYLRSELAARPASNPRKSSLLTARAAKPILVLHDLLEWNGEDLRHLPYSERYALLVEYVKENAPLQVSVAEVLPVSDEAHLQTLVEDLRKRGADALLLKHRLEPYPKQPETKAWIRLKPQAHTVWAVLMYVSMGQVGSRGAGTEYTFGVWKDNSLISVTKTKLGITEALRKELDAFVKEHTIERFGPVRTVKPEWVFEIAFDKVLGSTRHKSGLVLEGARVLQRLTSKSIAEAHQLEDLKSLIFVDTL